MCEICKTSISEEVHHLQPQKDANKDGFIGNFHKNHVANLLNVCEKCHNEFHSPKTEEKQKKIIKRKTTKGYIITNEPI
jgi:hypothetical protein